LNIAIFLNKKEDVKKTLIFINLDLYYLSFLASWYLLYSSFSAARLICPTKSIGVLLACALILFSITSLATSLFVL
jgi:hypothetical protein